MVDHDLFKRLFAGKPSVWQLDVYWIDDDLTILNSNMILMMVGIKSISIDN